MDLKLGKCPEELIMTTADSKKIIELNAKLEALKMVSSLIDNFRESYTRELVVSGIGDETELKKKLESYKIAEVEEEKNIDE